MNRRVIAILLACALGAAVSSTTPAQEPGVKGPVINRSPQKEKATLEEQLNSGLKVRTASERAFTAKVAATVKEGQLSESLVKAIFQRAREQHSRYPLPYFAAILKQVAKQKGVQL